MKWTFVQLALVAVMMMALSARAAELSPVERGEKAYPNKAAWIAALVADLDQVNAQQMEMRGGVYLGDDPDVRALIACGDEAVGPLVDCMEQDDLLTKSQYSPSGMRSDQHNVRVSEVAYYAASAILKISFFKPRETADVLSSRNADDRKRIFDAVQAYWNKYKSLPIEERWFRTLEDDQATPDDWLQAMENIARPVDDQLEYKMAWRDNWETIPDAGTPLKLCGEELRAKSNPSVTDLAARRIEQIDQLNAASEDRVAGSYPAMEMAVRLSRWDPAGCKTAVERQLQYCLDLDAVPGYLDRMRLTYFIADLAGALGNAGDSAGLKTYCDFLRSMKINRMDLGPADILAPLYKFRDDPAIAAATDWLFNDPASAWNPIVPKISAGFEADDLIHSPLLGVRSFRAQIERGLGDDASYGTIILGKDGEPVLSAYGSTGGVRKINSNGHINIAPEFPATVRMRDHYAQAIAVIAGAPEFQMYWVEPQRDEAIRACRQFLERYGERLGALPRRLDDDNSLLPKAYLIFPLLDQCASQAQVDSAAAIFSLDGQGERRQFKLPDFPVKGKWVTLKKYGYDEPSYDYTAKKPIVEHRFEQDCWVWQAEEVKINGVWQRYFGVVGPHEVERVPAAEIELPGKWPWSNLTDGIDFRAESPGTPPPHGDYFNHATLGSPLMVRMFVRNRRGIAQPLPGAVIGKNADGRLAIREGVTITLKKSGLRSEAYKATEIPVKPLAVLSADAAAKKTVVETGEEILIGEFDLRDCFDIKQPGQYNLQFRFTKPGGFTEGWSNGVAFKLVEES